jgi:flagella basal body P-ring formation protein FlgA
MNSLLLVFLSFPLSFFCLLPSQQTWALEGETVLETKELRQVFLDLATDHNAISKNDFEISKFTATPESITVPPGSLDFRVISGQQHPGKALGQQVIVADVLVDGVVQERIKLSGDLALFREVICITSTLPRHSIIEAHNLQRVRHDITMLGPDLINDESAAIGKVIKTTLQAGSILYSKTLTDPELAKRGDIISILAANDSLTISVPGRALTSGTKGEMIRVKNMMSRREIVAKIIGPGVVQAQF